MQLSHERKKISFIKLKKSTKVLALSTGIIISIFENNYFNISKVKASSKEKIGISNNQELSKESLEIMENEKEYIVNLNFSKENLEEDIKKNIIEKINILKECTDESKDIVLKIRCDEITRSINEIINIIPKNEKVKTLYINKLKTTSQPINFHKKLSKTIMQKFPNLKELNIMAYKIELGSLEQMTNLESLTIMPSQNNYNAHIETDFNKLTFLSELKIIDNLSNIPIYLTTENYETLKNNNVKITFNFSLAEQKSNNNYFHISKELDKIITELNLKKDSTTLEKANAISCYVMETLKYDPEIAKGNEEHKRWYYSQGDLYPVFHPKTDEKLGICGTYAALTKALMNRVCPHNICDTVISENHAWNTILIGDELYYLDTTWMDDQQARVTIKNEYATKIHYTQVTMPIINALTNYQTADMSWYLNSKENMEQLDKHNCHNLIEDPYWDKIYSKEASIKNIDVLETKLEELLIKLFLNKEKVIEKTFITVECLLILIYILKKEKNNKTVKTQKLYSTYCENYKHLSVNEINLSEYELLFSHLDCLLEKNNIANKNQVNMQKIRENKYALEKLKHQIQKGQKLDKHFIKKEIEKNDYFYQHYDASNVLNYIFENIDILKKYINEKYIYIFDIFMNQEGQIKDIDTIIKNPHFQKLDNEIKTAFLNTNQIYNKMFSSNICNSKQYIENILDVSPKKKKIKILKIK